MTYFYFPGWGMYDLNGLSEKELSSTFAHGYPTAALAQAHPNASPNALQAAMLQTFNAASVSPVGAAGGSGVLSTPHSTGGITGAAKNVTSSLWNNLDLRQVLIQVGEVILGIVLIGVGMAKITGTDNVVNRAAKTAGMAAIL